METKLQNTSQELTQEQKERLQEVYQFAAEHLSAGNSPHDTRQALVQKGFDQETAEGIVDQIEAASAEHSGQDYNTALYEAGKKNLVVGLLWAVGGTVVTVATYSSASEGGSYVVAWGAIVFGAIQAGKGLMDMSDSKDPLQDSVTESGDSDLEL